MNVEIRIYNPLYARMLVDIFYNTIHKINIQDYTLEQVNAWAPESFLSLESWAKKWSKLKPLVAVSGDRIVGFAEFEDNGYIDCFYVHHEFQRCGVGTALMNAIYRKAQEKHINKIYAEVSITAKPFFESQGFNVLKKQLIEKRGIKLKNYKMEIDLKEKKLLTGGRVTQNVVKIGKTVRRPLTKNSDFVHQLLLHLEKIGFNGSPRFLGIDESNQEILSYLDGNVPPELDEWNDQQLIAIAKLIRNYHDATTTFNIKGTDEVVCHNDLSPCNTVMKKSIPIALIDFDAAAPGSRVSDFAYAVWMWCDLGNEDVSPAEQGRKIKIMLEGYDLLPRQRFIPEIVKIQKKQIKKFQLNVKQGLLHWDDAAKWAEECARWVTVHQAELERILMSL